MYLKLSPSNFSVKKKKKLFPKNLNFGFCTLHPISTFIYGVTIASRVRGDIKKSHYLQNTIRIVTND